MDEPKLAANSSATLRRRMNILERAHSMSKLNHSSEEITPKGSPPATKESRDLHDSEEEEAEATDREYESESGSASSRTELSGSPKRDTLPRHDDDERNSPPRSSDYVSHRPARARSWYEFDLAVVAALVSPVGNWLTGADHIKNILFVMLLVFYLHQIIEIPWTLYHNSRPRVHPRSNRAFTAEDSHRKHAVSELRFLEFMFFSFAVVSPLLGAYLLRYVTFAVTGQDIHSWFSTGLFVLATGVRPWTHLVQRFNRRVTDLHDIVHYHSAGKEGDDDDVSGMRRQLEVLRGQVREMEKAMEKLNKKLAKETDEVYEYVDERAESVEQAVKRHEKALEYVLQLPSSLSVPSRPSPSSKSSSSSKPSSPLCTPSSSASSNYLQSPNHSGTPSLLASKLETIHEGKEILSLKPNISTPAAKTVVVKPNSASAPSPPGTAQPESSFLVRSFFVVLSLMNLPALIFVHALYAMTWPLRWSFRMLLRLAGVEAITLPKSFRWAR